MKHYRTIEEIPIQEYIDYFKVVPEERLVHHRYIFYLLKRAIEEMWASEHTHGSTMKHINRGPFLAHQVPIAPFREQDRIVETPIASWRNPTIFRASGLSAGHSTPA